ncbi:MAG: HAD-IIB family hydrolase [Bdellovibrionaceae bacterium]|nr:HAD-IIB family hydrolase [Pseudobdellovibrionaceae bacterium]MDW8190350.1 HAD-IIB family hydrolase [Pseudobdellovibrionaceae bacterium]
MQSSFLKNPQKILLTDLDDTLTTHGKLTAEAYQGLWDLYLANIAVIPVTGRPAGYCELIARWWPVSAVIGENGAFYFWMKNDRMYRWYHPEAHAFHTNKKRFALIEKEVLKQFPRAQVASDQFCRLFDLAIDFAEDVNPPLGLTEAEQIKKIFEQQGAHAKVSSIHVNGWFGSYTKLDTSLKLLEDLWQIDSSQARETVYFVGDSANDAPMFGFFKKSFGVANIRPFLKNMTHSPSQILKHASGEGFVELCRMLLARP